MTTFRRSWVGRSWQPPSSQRREHGGNCEAVDDESEDLVLGGDDDDDAAICQNLLQGGVVEMKDLRPKKTKTSSITVWTEEDIFVQSSSSPTTTTPPQSPRSSNSSSSSSLAVMAPQYYFANHGQRPRNYHPAIITRTVSFLCLLLTGIVGVLAYLHTHHDASRGLLQSGTAASFLPAHTLNSILRDPESAQAMALEWIEEKYPHFTLLETWRKRQLMALATLTIAACGEMSNHYNPRLHECQWMSRPNEYCDDDGRYLIWTPTSRCNSLTWQLPPQIGLLTGLTALELRDQQLTGSLPTEIGLLTMLMDLDVSKNSLTGSLFLASNNNNNKDGGDGDVFFFLSQLTLLGRLRASQNHFVGPIPSQLGLMTDLVLLELEENLLSGSLPTQLGQLTYLQELLLSANQLTGSIPTSLITKLTELQEIDLGGNQLRGTIPTEIGHSWTDNLHRLVLGSNKFYNTLPTQLGLLTNLIELDIAKNSLMGTIPTQLAMLSETIEELSLHDNFLTTMGGGGSSSTDHTFLDEASLGKLTRLSALWLHNNSLTGRLPQLTKLSNLESLYLNKNLLTGTIPSMLCEFDALDTIWIDCDLIVCNCHPHCKC